MLKRRKHKIILSASLASLLLSGVGLGICQKMNAGIAGTLTGSAMGKDNAVQLNWAPPNSNEKYSYRLYSKGPNDSVFQTIPAKSDVKVLNVYPSAGDNLKGWMDGGASTGHIFTDKLDIDVFNANPSAYLGSPGNWKYDVVVFGFYDCNGGKGLSDAAVNLVRQFIASGRGYLAGHDTFSNTGFYNLRDLLNIDFGATNPNTNPTGTGITVRRKGLLTNYPWNIGDIGTKLTIPASHMNGAIFGGDIWMTFDGYNTDGYNSYLQTWNNTAYIMTGHSNGAATTDEQHLLANTIFYLAQVTESTSWQDHKGQDMAVPNAPAVNSIKPSKSSLSTAINISAQDNGHLINITLNQQVSQVMLKIQHQL